MLSMVRSQPAGHKPEPLKPHVKTIFQPHLAGPLSPQQTQREPWKTFKTLFPLSCPSGSGSVTAVSVSGSMGPAPVPLHWPEPLAGTSQCSSLSLSKKVNLPTSHKALDGTVRGRGQREHFWKAKPPPECYLAGGTGLSTSHLLPKELKTGKEAPKEFSWESGAKDR